MEPELALYAQPDGGARAVKLPEVLAQAGLETHALQAEVNLLNQKLGSLLALTQAINSNAGQGDILEVYRRMLCDELGVGCMALFTFDEAWHLSVYHPGQVGPAVPADPVATFGTGADNPEHLLSPSLPLHDALLAQGYTHVVPVHHKEYPLGYLLLGALPWPPGGLRGQMLDYMQTATHIVVVALENKRLFKSQSQSEILKRELSMAAQMQQMLVPSVLPFRRPFSALAHYEPHTNVGGDYYDVIDLDGKRFLFCVADVSGKGPAAALLMANFQANLHALLLQDKGLEWMVKRLNNKVMDITRGERFITAFFGIIDTHNGRFTYVNAGHVPPMLRSNGRIQALSEGTIPLGIMELPSIAEGRLALQGRSELVCYTDGLSDLQDTNDEYFGDDALASFMNEAPTGIKAMMPDLRTRIDAFARANPQTGDKRSDDDLTLLMLEYWPEATEVDAPMLPLMDVAPAL